MVTARKKALADVAQSGAGLNNYMKIGKACALQFIGWSNLFAGAQNFEPKQKHTCHGSGTNIGMLFD